MTFVKFSQGQYHFLKAEFEKFGFEKAKVATLDPLVGLFQCRPAATPGLGKAGRCNHVTILWLTWNRISSPSLCHSLTYIELRETNASLTSNHFKNH